MHLENPDAAPGIRAMAPAILLVCLVSAYRGYCQGNGYFQGDITVKDTELVPCPKCGGTGKVKGIVTVDWVPDGEVKPCLKGNSNDI